MFKKSRTVPYLITFCVSVAFLVLGAYSSWYTPVLNKFNRNETDVDIDKYMISWMVSMNPLGFIAGSFVTRYTADSCGRRVTLLAGAPPLVVGSIITVFAEAGWLLCFTTFLWGCGTGMLSTVIGIYIAEISEEDIRATLSLCTRLAFNLGNLIVMIIGPVLSYQTLNNCLLPLPIIYLVLGWWIPETPYFLLKKGRIDQAKKVLRKLRRYEDEQAGQDELQKMQEGVKKQMTYSSSVVELFSGKQYRKAVIISAGLKVSQIMTGSTCIKQYLGVIMEQSRLEKQYESIVFIVYGAITFVVAMVSTVLVDRMGRRPLLISSYLGTALSLAFVGLYFFFIDVIHIDHNFIGTKVFNYAALAGIILSSVISSFGFLALTMVIPAEIFPINVKAVAMTSLNVFGGILGFSMGKGYQYMVDWISQCGLFWFCSTVALFGAIFTFYVIPETGGKGLNDIQNELQEDVEKVNGLLSKVSVKDEREVESMEMDKLRQGGEELRSAKLDGTNRD